MNIRMDIHNAGGIVLEEHMHRNTTEWASIRIGELRITVYDRASIDAALMLPKSEFFRTNIHELEAAE